jgi:hypothetical protein
MRAQNGVEISGVGVAVGRGRAMSLKPVPCGDGTGLKLCGVHQALIVIHYFPIAQFSSMQNKDLGPLVGMPGLDNAEVIESVRH